MPHQLRPRPLDVSQRLFDVLVDADGHVALLGHERRELLEDSPQLGNGGLDLLQGPGPGRQVRVLRRPLERLLLELLLLMAAALELLDMVEEGLAVIQGPFMAFGLVERG